MATRTSKTGTRSGAARKDGKTTVRRAKTPARARKTTKTVPIEDVECMNFASWLRDRNIPHTHIPNESRSGKKDAAIRARKLQKMGVSRGVWDYEIWVPIYNCDGEIDDYQLLKIEMKRQRGGGSTTSPEQRNWGKIYAAAGVPCKVCYGAAEAEAFVEEYWRDPRFNDDEVF